MKRLAVRIPAVKYPLYMTEHLPGGQLPLVLWRWPSISKIKWIGSTHQRVTLSTHYLNYVMKRIGDSV